MRPGPAGASSSGNIRSLASEYSTYFVWSFWFGLTHWTVSEVSENWSSFSDTRLGKGRDLGAQSSR